jgi:uncharacterized membrane protein YozB (DUF420 family)
MFKKHGKIMTWAVALHLIVILGIMVPSFVAAVIPEYIIANTFGAISLVSLVHVPLGIAAVSFGVWFVLKWRQQGLAGCSNRRRKMFLTMIIWLASISLGMILYALFYWSLLMG